MHRGLVHVLAWSLATSAAVTLSWWGVHTVMAGTAYDPPRALPITAAGASTHDSTPLASSTHRPAPSKSPSRRPSEPSRTPAAPDASRSAPASSPTGPSPTVSGHIKSYDTAGGRAVFDLGTASATLVSATPGTGWSMQVWKTSAWIRVEFTSGTDRVSVICTWHDGPPHVEVGTY
ncbi:hypothetical protein [Streptomyces carpinensis]|uniref:hypothetical protein n=1 Tax=Streptomyces carpinensis TaxID=66369 RepID=UPI000A38614F|nr:hypothetical protein [Streptomyces carpinensis]